MGLASVRIQIRHHEGAADFCETEALVDSGAICSLAPTAALMDLGIRPTRDVEFILADASRIKRQAGDAYFEYDGHVGAAPVISGEGGDKPLLGVTTLEAMGLMLDPLKRRLIPMRMLLT